MTLLVNTKTLPDLSNLQPVLDKLAHGWLARGAPLVGLRYENEWIASWKRENESVISGFEKDEATLSLVGSLSLGGLGSAELIIIGLEGKGNQSQLEAEAHLLNSLISSEKDLNLLTAELVDLQDQLLALYDLSQSVRNHLTVEETLKALATEAARLIGAQYAFAYLINSSRPPIYVMIKSGAVQVESEDNWLNNDGLALKSFQFLAEEISSNESEILLNDLEVKLFYPNLSSNLKNMLCSPMSIQEDCHAGLGLLNKAGGFSTPDLKLVKAITLQSGSHLQNVLLTEHLIDQTKMKAELEMAAWIQLRLLPRSVPLVEGLDIGASMQPASLVGGDYYDFVQKSGNPFFFSVGDVSGKGMGAALLMAMCHSVIRSKAKFIPHPTPATIISRVNEDLYSDFTEVGMFATTFVGTYEQETGKLVYANAGHSPVIFCPKQGAPYMLEADGTAMGVLPMCFSEDQFLVLNPGDILVVATDGFSEATNSEGEMFGYERLLKLVKASSDQSAEKLVETLLETVRLFTGDHPQDDDQTIVILKRTTEKKLSSKRQLKIKLDFT